MVENINKYTSQMSLAYLEWSRWRISCKKYPMTAPMQINIKIWAFDRSPELDKWSSATWFWSDRVCLIIYWSIFYASWVFAGSRIGYYWSGVLVYCFEPVYYGFFYSGLTGCYWGLTSDFCSGAFTYSFFSSEWTGSCYDGFCWFEGSFWFSAGFLIVWSVWFT